MPMQVPPDFSQQAWTDALPETPFLVAASSTVTRGIRLNPGTRVLLVALSAAGNVTSVTVTGGGSAISYFSQSSGTIPALIAVPCSYALDEVLNVAVTTGAGGPCLVYAIGHEQTGTAFSIAGAAGTTTNLTQVGGAAIALGQALMAASLPVAIASNQGNLPTNIAQVGGTAIALGQALMAASLPVTIASNQGNLPTNIAQVGGSAIALGQALMAASLPVAIASNQGNLPTNIAQVGGAALALGSALMAASIPVTIASNQITIAQNVNAFQQTSTGTSAQLVAQRNTRSHCLIENLDASNSVWLGQSPATTTMFQLKAGASLDYQSGAALFVIDNNTNHAVLAVLDQY